jgi:hypothetical protein
MATTGPAGKSKGRHADSEPSAVLGQPEPAPNAGMPQAVLPADAETGPPDDLEQLQQQIELTRDQLGETVEELAAKADVPARAREKASAVKAKAQGKAGEVSGQVKAKVTELSGQLRRSPVVQRRWPLAVIAGVLAAGSVAIWRWRKT